MIKKIHYNVENLILKMVLVDKINWNSLCITEIPNEIFEGKLNKINWESLCSIHDMPNIIIENKFNENFNGIFNKIEIEQNKDKFNKTCFEIKNYVNIVPKNSFSCLPNGGKGYLEMLSKYI